MFCNIIFFRVSFVDSKPQGNPKPTAGNQGTIITVEDLFYNMNVRKNALRSPADEYQKIADVISKYAVHNSHVGKLTRQKMYKNKITFLGFALKKFAETNDIRTPQNSNTIENIKIIYGVAIARELIEFSLDNPIFKFSVKGFISNLNYSTKRMQFLLFINNRLVDCQSKFKV